MKQFLKQMLSGASDVSSKRTGGLFCILISSILIGFYVLTKIEPTEIESGLVKTLFIGGLALLGVASLEKFWT